MDIFDETGGIRIKTGKTILLLIVVLHLLIFFPGCAPVQYEPEEGVWYCDELQIQLSYERDVPTYIVEDGEMILCACGSDRGVKWLEVSNQDAGYHANLGEVLFYAEILRLDESELVVYCGDLDKEYTFVRVD